MPHNLDKVRNIIAVAAGKGGVGKSTVALNLALYLAAKKESVGLIDADIYGPSMGKMLRTHIPPSQDSEREQRIIPAQFENIRFVTMAHFLKGDEAASVRAPIANGIIKQFIHDVEWGDLDTLIIDFPPGTGDIQLTLVQEAHLSGAILVTTPQEIALLDVAKTVAMFRHMQVPLLGLIENMSYFMPDGKTSFYPFGQGGGEGFARKEGIYFLGAIPIEPEISRCCDRGISIFSASPENSAAKSFSTIGDHMIEQLAAFEKLGEDRLKNFDLQWKR